MHLPTAISILQGLGFRTFVLPSSGIVDVASFFSAVKAVLPLDPPVEHPVWDALDDSLWEGMFQQPEVHHAIIWPNASEMERTSPDDFAIARDVFIKVAATLANERATLGIPRVLVVVLERDASETER